MQRPQNFDTACRLALLQEEVASSPSKSYRSGDWPSSYKPLSAVKTPLPLPPPPKVEKAPIPAVPSMATPQSTDSTLKVVKAYRRALGLCFKCAGKWSKDHRCPPEVLMAVEALWLDFDDDEIAPVEDVPERSDEQLCMAVSKAAFQGAAPTRAILFQGFVQDCPVRILIDSGSSASFLSASLVQQLSAVPLVFTPSQVQVAGGGLLHSPGILKDVQWTVDQCHFQSDFRVLQLSSYDVIIGMDWLEAHSPMQVHWCQKWLAIPYHGQFVLLQGLNSVSPSHLYLQICAVQDVSSDLQQPVVLPTEIQSLLDQYQHLFEPPTELPPSRACNHRIPLIPGAQPVFTRPYRYPPGLKDEIERQVSDMLAQGLIQPSSSSFSSPVLLVKKKDDSYRFCVDFRQLNAITAKSKFPVPVFDQLMDELSHASWFSNLDLCAGFHQILLHPGEEHKTAFQTHLGQYEFRVMAFGLTGAPGTFQGAMNVTLAPGLRKFVLVFFDDILVYSRTFEDHLAHLAAVFQWLSADN
jgi:hypothetical protein